MPRVIDQMGILNTSTSEVKTLYYIFVNQKLKTLGTPAYNICVTFNSLSMTNQVTPLRLKKKKNEYVSVAL